MQIHIEAVGVLAPGMPDWDSARAVLAGQSALASQPLPALMPQCLPPAERRRSSSTVRLAIAVAEQALQHTPIAAQDMTTVFASAEAAAVITHQLCEELAGKREISPTQFHNSVHNAPSGYFSIAMGAKLAATSVCRGEWSFAAGLLAAATHALADNLPVLYVCYDSPMPPPLSAVMPVLEATAIALVITPGATDRSLACWNLSLCAAKPGAQAWPQWMPASWQANATARGFAALAGLAGGGCAIIGLPCSPELDVEIATC
jgi:Beta-ketoacyl synthase, N-terminal domain